MIGKLAFAVCGAIMLTACSLDPKAYETPEITVDTAEGPVTCQLYTKSMVEWDRAVSRPNSMSVATADALCREEGMKRK